MWKIYFAFAYLTTNGISEFTKYEKESKYGISEFTKHETETNNGISEFTKYEKESKYGISEFGIEYINGDQSGEGLQFLLYLRGSCQNTGQCVRKSTLSRHCGDIAFLFK